MSQQVNLYDVSLQRQRDWLSAGNLVIVVGGVLLAIVAWGWGVRSGLGALEAEAAATAARLKSLEGEAQVLRAQATDRKPDPRLAEEVAAARIEMENRQTLLAALDKGLGPQAASFAEYLRGLARQSTSGLWLTGFAVDADNDAMEIRGRLIAPSTLADYIRRLNGERIFQGRSFAALQMKAGMVPAAGSGTTMPAAAPPAASLPPPFHEFTLVPEKPAVPAAQERRP